jgi:alkylated DNA repair dioxygenase AlkB
LRTLFDIHPEADKNLLPRDGIVHYFGKVFQYEEANRNYKKLLNEIDWQHDQARIFGKTYITKRKVAWYADHPFPYRYSGATKIALPWTPELIELKTRVEKASGEIFNSCLLNLYHSGAEGMAWHSDGEKELKENGAIASLSFGAERKFSFKHKQTKKRIDIWLEHGSLLMMQGETQRHWLHRLPPTKKVATPRINLTFRQIRQNA